MKDTTTGHAPASKPNQCTATRRDGQQCRAQALVDGLCFSHSPTTKAKRDAARQAGGKNRASVVRLHALLPPRLLPVYFMLEGALTEVHDGQLDPKRAHAMAALGRALVAVLQSGELESRMRAIEERLEGGAH